MRGEGGGAVPCKKNNADHDTLPMGPTLFSSKHKKKLIYYNSCVVKH